MFESIASEKFPDPFSVSRILKVVLLNLFDWKPQLGKNFSCRLLRLDLACVADIADINLKR